MKTQFVLLLCLTFQNVANSQFDSRKNVLFLVADDLRPNLGFYDNSGLFNSQAMHTPNLDKLSEKSIVFDMAYCQTALCGPSRASFLTSRRPDTTHVHENKPLFRDVGGNFTTIPGFFRNHGYKTIGVGKIFHNTNNNTHKDDVAYSWSEHMFHAKDHDIHNMSYTLVSEEEMEKKPLRDTVQTNYAIEKLREMAPNALLGVEPFFLALGIHKPHLPWDFPAEFYHKYSHDDMELPYNIHCPTEMPNSAWGDFHNIRENYYDCSNEAMGIPELGQINVTYPHWKIKQMRRSYYASVSYMDHEFGRLLDELELLGLAENTIIVFFGDHGYQLGEHAEWVKWNNFDITARAPLMLNVPGKTDLGKSIHTKKLVEFVDILPTLAEAAELPVVETCPENSNEIETCTEGTSLIPLIDNPEMESWKSAVFYQRGYGWWNTWNVSGIHMAYNIRTEDWRYTEYVFMTDNGDNTVSYTPDWDNHSDDSELYDHAKDPLETVNLYNKPEYEEVRRELQDRLRAGWREEILEEDEHGGIRKKKGRLQN